jgi:cholesterol transport system auxiliary component
MKTSPLISRWVAILFSSLLLAGLGGLTGCLSKPPLKVQTFMFEPPANETVNPAAHGRVLGVRNLRVAAPFEGPSLVYRLGEFSYVRDPYAQFLEPPDEELLAPVCGWLRNSGNFRSVVPSGSAVKPDTLVEISFSQLFGDFRQTEHPTAVLTMQFIFLDAPDGVPGKVILQREYSRTIPLKAASAAALMTGWEQGLIEILAEASADFRISAQ